MSPPGVRYRSLIPREHGAYAEVGFPLLTVWSHGVPGSAALQLSAAVLCVFFLHEPLLVLLGHRGPRHKRESGGAAARLAALLGAGGLAFGASGLWASPPAARWSAFIPLAFGLALLPLTALRREKTLLGELLAGAALITASVPVALAAAMPIHTVLTVTLVWCAAFGLGTLAVRAVVAGAKGGARGLRAVTWLLAIAAVLAAIWLASLALPGGSRAALAVMPGSVVVISCLWLRIPPRRLRAMGWSLAASSVLTFCLLLALL